MFYVISITIFVYIIHTEKNLHANFQYTLYYGGDEEGPFGPWC